MGESVYIIHIYMCVYIYIHVCMYMLDTHYITNIFWMVPGESINDHPNSSTSEFSDPHLGVSC